MGPAIIARRPDCGSVDLSRGFGARPVATAKNFAGPEVPSGVGDTGVRWSMLAAHLAAAWLTAVVLRWGEDGCWRIADILARPARSLRAVAGCASPDGS